MNREGERATFGRQQIAHHGDANDLRFRRCHELKSEDDGTICLSDRDTSRRKLSPHLKVQIAFERSGGLQVLEAPHLELESKRGEPCFNELHFCRRIGKNVGVMCGGSE